MLFNKKYSLTISEVAAGKYSRPGVWLEVETRSVTEQMDNRSGDINYLHNNTTTGLLQGQLKG